MLFPTFTFMLFFFPLTAIVYFLLGKKSTTASQLFLVLASVVFYSWFHWSYSLLLIGSIFVNHFFLKIKSLTVFQTDSLKKSVSAILAGDTHLFYIILENPSNRENRTITCIGYNNTRLGRRCMHDLSVSNIKCHMSGIANKITGLCILK